MEAVERAACVGDVVDPLGRMSAIGDGVRMCTFSGSATIMWQSMNMPGTPLETQERIGAPGGTLRRGQGEKESGLAHGDIGDEVAVHDIHVQPFSPTLDHALAFCTELPKVGREDGR